MAMMIVLSKEIVLVCGFRIDGTSDFGLEDKGLHGRQASKHLVFLWVNGGDGEDGQGYICCGR
jgi:hypothetical protein